MTLAALERAQETREQFERSIGLHSRQTESYYRLGLLGLELRDYAAAKQNLQRVVARNPKHTRGLSALGKMEFEQKHYSEAVSFLRQAIRNDYSLREAHYYFGLTLARMGCKQESSDELQIAARLEHEEAGRRRTVTRIGGPGDPERQKSLTPK